MAYYNITNFYTNENGGGTITVNYETDTHLIDVLWSGSGDVPVVVPESDLAVPPGEFIKSICVGFDKHVFRSKPNWPFVELEYQLNSPDCGYTPPTDPPPPPPGDPVQDPYGLIYQIRFDNIENQRVVINIYDTTVRAATLTVISLADDKGRVPADTLVISTIDSDEDKFTPIKAKRATFKFFSSSNYSMSTFAFGEDNRFYVEIYLNTETNIIFKGFLVQDDHSEYFMPHPKVVTLVATDNLGLLKDQPLVNDDSETPKGNYVIAQYINWCLKKTGLTLDFKVIHNLRHTFDSDEHYWYVTSLDAKTFEDEIGTCVDCYTALEMILGEQAFLTQWMGEWLIARVDELDGRRLYVATFSAADITYTIEELPPYEKKIGIDLSESIIFINEATQVKLTRPFIETRIDFNYDYPKEIINNIDFSQGDISLIAPGPNWTAYDLDGWTLKNGFPYSANTPQSSVYIKRTYEDGYEKDRYLVITAQTTANNNSNHVESNAIPMEVKDKFTISVDYRFPQEITNFSQSVHVMSVRLIGENGSYWWLGKHPDTGVDTWYLSDSTFGNNSARATYFLNFNEPGSETDWKTLSRSAPPLPVGGMVYVTLHAMNTRADFTQDNTDIYYQNLQFTYEPYINGSYLRYSGHYHKAFKTGNYKGRRKELVSVSTSPRMLFKGTLLWYSILSTYPYNNIDISNVWFDYSLDQTPSTFKDFGWWQVFAIWNQYRRTNRLFEKECRGLDSNGLPPDLIHQYIVTDASSHSTNKRFVLLHYEQNYQTCIWRGLIAETNDTTDPKIYTDNYEFRFIEDR